MQPKSWKIFWTRILLASSSVNWCLINVNPIWAINSSLDNFEEKLESKGPSLLVDQMNHQPYQHSELERVNLESKLLWLMQVNNTLDHKISKIAVEDGEIIPMFSPPSILSASGTSNLYSQAIPTSPNLVQDFVSADAADNTQQNIEPVQLEVEPTDTPISSSTQTNQSLETSNRERKERIQKLRQRLQRNKLILSESNSELDIDEELGKLKLQEVSPTLEEIPIPSTTESVDDFKPVGYLLTRFGYFHSSNIFSSGIVPTQDSLVYSGLTLGSASIPLGNATFINGSIDGYLIRYLDQAKYNYNQVKFNFNLHQKLSQRMYGEVGWSNQQLFYARNGDNFNAGDRFLGENSLRLSLGRRDTLSQKMVLDSFYELRLSLTDPPKDRNRIMNFLWLSLSYYLQNSLQVGADYQLSLSNFTERDREDLYSRFFGHVNYGISKTSNVSLQAGLTLGNSTENDIDFDGWFLGINYNFELGRF